MDFNLNCTQYIKRAADSSSVETAKEELSKAISYAEEKGLTEGIVSIIWEQPKNDIGYWYQNLKNAYLELEKIPEDASQLESSNVLMRVRESLIDQTDSGTKVTIPDGIGLYPNNKVYFVWDLILGIGAFIMWIITRALW